MNDAADAEDAESVLDDVVGPFYDAEGVVRYLALCEGADDPLQALEQMLERIAETLRRRRALIIVASASPTALWMCVPAPDLGGLTAAGYLAEDASDVRLEYVTMLADLDSERWLQ